MSYLDINFNVSNVLKILYNDMKNKMYVDLFTTILWTVATTYLNISKSTTGGEEMDSSVAGSAVKSLVLWQMWHQYWNQIRDVSISIHLQQVIIHHSCNLESKERFMLYTLILKSENGSFLVLQFQLLYLLNLLLTCFIQRKKTYDQ